MADDKRTRRQFTAEDKAAALKRHLVGKEPVSSVCEALGIVPNLFYRWQQDLFENAAAAFEVKGRGRPAETPSRKLVQENEKLRTKLAHKDIVIAEITQEYVHLKKNLGED